MACPAWDSKTQVILDVKIKSDSRASLARAFASMVGVIVVSENKSSAEMLKTVRSVLDHRRLKGIVPLSLKSSGSKRSLQTKVGKAINKLYNYPSILILSELVGSTQSNVCRDFIEEGRVEMICGYNIPMLIKAATCNEKHSLPWFKKTLLEAGKKYLKGSH